MSNNIERSAGYTELIERYNLEIIPNWHISYVTTSVVSSL